MRKMLVVVLGLFMAGIGLSAVLADDAATEPASKPASKPASQPASGPTSRKVVVAWTGEDGKWAGWGWHHNAGNISVVDNMGHSGNHSICFTGQSGDYARAGWHWFGGTDKPPGGVDCTNLTYMDFWVKCKGTPRADTEMQIRGIQHSETGGVSSSVYIGNYCPNWRDGEWHEVAIPLDRFHGNELEMDSIREISFIVTPGSPSGFSIYIDDITFDNR
jgi:hypothetical protein